MSSILNGGKIVDTTKNYIEIHRGDILYANLAGAMGSEQDGIRPVLVLQNNVGNRFSPTVIVVPITGKKKRLDLPTHVDLGSRFGLCHESVVMLEQIRAIDKSRISRFVGAIDKRTMKEIEIALEISLGQRPLPQRGGGDLE